jgi:hypothetical protein
MTDLTLHGQRVGTVFNLLGDKENDLTFSLGWGLAQSEALAERLLTEVFPGEDIGCLQAVRLQEFIAGSGFTDIEIESDRVAVVLEAKRGWVLPPIAQLERYAPRLAQSKIGRMLVVSECMPAFAGPRVPTEVVGIPVVYRSWQQIVEMAESCSPPGHTEKRIVRELTTYLRGLMTMQNQTSNLVYVVALGREVQPWSAPFTPIQIVVEQNRYFHPIGKRYPKEPQNYVGFRWDGRLQQIRHVEHYEVFTDPHEHIPEIPSQDFGERHYLYHLGPPIIPPRIVRTGGVYRAAHAEAAIDLLLTCDTISEAHERTRQRLQAAGAGIA